MADWSLDQHGAVRNCSLVNFAHSRKFHDGRFLRRLRSRLARLADALRPVARTRRENALLDIGAALVFIVADHDSKVPLDAAEAVEPVKFGGHPALGNLRMIERYLLVKDRERLHIFRTTRSFSDSFRIFRHGRAAQAVT